MAEAAIARYLICETDGVMPAWDEKDAHLTPLSRARMASIGEHYLDNREALDEEGLVIVACDPASDDERWPAAARLSKHLGNMYGIPKERRATVDSGNTPFAVFGSIVKQRLLEGIEFTPERPLAVVASRSYGRMVLAPIARAAFGLEHPEAVTVLPAEREGPRGWLRTRADALATEAALRDAEGQPFDSQSLDAAAKRYEVARDALRRLPRLFMPDMVRTGHTDPR